MSDPSTPAETHGTSTLPAHDANALRVVLFGMPGAGKSSLLGALAQAAQTQEHLLNGRLIDRSGGLAELKQRLYEGNSRPTAEEVVPYLIEFEPFSSEGNQPVRRRQAVLIDCDGRVANDLLARRRSLSDDSADGTLAREVLEADCLVLVIDAAAPAPQVDSDFTEFGRFLRLLEKSRGERSEVGGLPVILILTKCDLLAKPEDSAVDWYERIEDRKRQVHRRFQDFLAKQQREGPLPFGKIDLHLWATAVKRPPLTGTPAKPREPYGVAELFRQGQELARTFRQRRRQSGRRLVWTVGGAVGLLAAMAAVAAALIFGPQQRGPSALHTKIRNYQSQEKDTPSGRLRGDLQARISDLNDFRNDPEFEALPEKVKEEVEHSLHELTDYQKYRAKLDEVRPLAGARREDELEEIEKSLARIEVPSEYGKQWDQTEKVLERKERLEDVKRLRSAMTAVEDWYRDLVRSGEMLLRFGPDGPGTDAGGNWLAWHQRVRDLLGSADEPRYRESDRISGSSSLTYATAFGFARVVQARGEWRAVRSQLERIRDISAALGMAGSLPERPSLLVIAKPPDFTLAAAAERVQKLAEDYRGYQEQFTLTDLPESAVRLIRQAARPNYMNALAPARQWVLRELFPADSTEHKDTPARWERVAALLAKNPAELTGWRGLIAVLGRLADPEAPDPVNALLAFLREREIPIRLKRVLLEVPKSLGIEPAGKLTIRVDKDGKAAMKLEAGVRAQNDMIRKLSIWTLQPDLDSPQSLKYTPGQVMWAWIPVKHGSEDKRLTWAYSRTGTYEYEVLLEPPRLHRTPEDFKDAEPLPSVRLVVADGEIPPVPDLLPDVNPRPR